MRWLNPLQENRRVALLERARFCHRYGLELRHLAVRSPSLGASFREAAGIHFRRRDALLAELRVLVPKVSR